MDRTSKRHLMDIATHRGYDEMKLKKKAGSLRRALKKGKGGGGAEGPLTEENWETLLDEESTRTRRRRRPSLGELAEGLREMGEEAEAAGDGDYATAAIVISVSSARCRVFRDGEELDCSIPPELATRQKASLAVGDRVHVEENEGVFRVAAVLPRHSVLARPDPLNKHLQRLIAANVDVVIHVVSVKAPPLRPRLIDRFLIAIQRGGAQPVICVNKIELLTDEQRAEELAKVEAYRDLGVPVIACSTRTGEGIDELRGLVTGQMAALVGHSGVGKSSILNALDQRLQLVTNTLHEKTGTGRHTTSASTLYDFGGGTYLIDTPGIREFGLWDLDRESLRDYFPELSQASELCRFTDCTHVHEPDCEVRRRVEAGELNRARFETYERLFHDLQ